MVLTSSRRYHHGMHDTGKVFFSFFWCKVVCALRSQRNGDCFTAYLKGLRTQMTGLKAQQLGAYLLANSGQKAQSEGVEEKAVKQKQRQEVILQTQTP